MPKMHGKSFADGETLVSTEVHPDNVAAFEAAGWKVGEHDDAVEASKHDAKIDAAKAKVDKEAEKEAAKEEPKAKK